ncbi:hypothetical protein ABEB36_002239 [Hypothenemus hampei]|uniref:Uncharacterized protein n=1 Tax=Hypothenemus hampei TaxID=57062 RepID=A0ABD1F5N6_HYPHA
MNQKMELTLNLVSKICWEIVAKHFVHLNTSNSVLFKLLSDTVSDFLPNVSEENLKIYWKYSPDDYLQIKDHYTFCALINLLVPSCDLYLLLKDEQQLHANADVYFKMLDLIELKRIKELTRNKYDLKSEADVIQEQIKKCQEILESSSHEEDVKLRNDKDIIQFALRNMPMRRCYTTDICSGYNLIDCFRKGWPKWRKVLAPLPDEVIERKIRTGKKIGKETGGKKERTGKKKKDGARKKKKDKKSKKL